MKSERPWLGEAKAVAGEIVSDVDFTATDRTSQSPICPPAPRRPEATEPPQEVAALPEALAKLDAILTRLAIVLGRQADERPRIEPMALRIEEVADSLGLSRRAVERERAAGRFPKPDVTVGKMPLWRPETVRGWLEKGGGR